LRFGGSLGPGGFPRIAGTAIPLGGRGLERGMTMLIISMLTKTTEPKT
jgi:hypothetical protein